MVAHACKRTRVQGQPGLHTDSLFEKKKDTFQKFQLRINCVYLRILLSINFILNVLNTYTKAPQGNLEVICFSPGMW